MKLLSIDIESSGLNYKNRTLLELGMVYYDSDIHGTDLSKIEVDTLPSLRLINAVNPDMIYWDDYAKQMHDGTGLLQILKRSNYEYSKVLTELKDSDKFDSDIILSVPSDLKNHIQKWLIDTNILSLNDFSHTHHKHNPIQVCGKNFFSFDINFIRKHIFETELKLSHRHIDPASLYSKLDDEKISNLKICKDRFIDEFINTGGLTVSDSVIDHFINNQEVAHTAVADAFETLVVSLYKMNKN